LYIVENQHFCCHQNSIKFHKQQKLLSHNFGSWKAQNWQIQDLARAAFWFVDSMFFFCLHMTEGTTERSLVSFVRAWIPLMRFCCQDQIISQRAYILTPWRLGLELNIWLLGAHKHSVYCICISILINSLKYFILQNTYILLPRFLYYQFLWQIYPLWNVLTDNINLNLHSPTRRTEKAQNLKIKKQKRWLLS
jgi:hypothetical protein